MLSRVPLFSGLSAAGGAVTSGSVVFSNSNGVSFGVNGNTVTASHNAITTGRASTDGIGLNTAQTNVTWTVNSNGLSFNAGGYAGTGFTSTTAAGVNIVGTNNTAGLSLGVPAFLTTAMASNRGSDFVQAGAVFNGTNATGTIASNAISVSVAAQTAQTQNLHNVTLSGNTAGVMAQVSSGTLTLAGGNNITLSQNGNAITISGANAGGVQTAISGIVVSDATYTSGTVSFSNAGNITVGSSVDGATQYIRLSGNAAQTTQSAIRAFGVSNTGNTAGNTGVSTGVDWVLAGSNSITLSQSTGVGGPNTVWFQHPAWLTTAMASNRGSDFVQATAAFAGTNASGTIASDGISVSVGNYITTAMLSNAVTLSNIRVSGGTTSNLLSAITFADGNGISFGLDASTITASHNGLTSQSNQNVTAANGGFAFQTLSFSNANGISFGTSAGSAITASHNALTSQSNQAFSADAASTFQTLVFQDSNGVSFSNNAGSLRVTHGLQFTSNTSNITSNALHSSASRVFNVVAATNNTGGGTASLSSDVSFTNANGVTFYTSAGGAVAASYTVPTVTNSSWTVSDAGTSGTVGRLAFTNLNGVTLSLSTGAAGLHTIVGSHNALTTARASNDAVGLNTAQTNVTWTVNSAGLSLNAGGYAGTGFTSTTTAGTAIVGTNNTAGLSIGVPAYLTTADLSANSSNYLRNWKLTGNTAGTTSSAQGTDFWLAGGNGITVSGSSNTISFSVGNYLTTARASNDAVGLNTAQTNVTWTVNSAGLSLNAGGYAGTGFTSTTTAGTAIVGTNNTAGLSLGVPAYLTTAMASNRGTDFVQATAVFNGTNASGTIASGAISVSVAPPFAGSQSIGASNLGNTLGTSGVASGSQVRFVLAASNGLIASQSVNGASATISLINSWSTATTVSAVASANVLGADAGRFALEGHQHAGVISAGVSNVGNTAGNTTVRHGNFVLAGSNAVTLSQETAAAGANTIHIQGPVSATTISAVQSANSIGTRGSRFALEDHYHAGVPAIAAGSNTGNTAGNTATQHGTWVIAGSNNITVSGSTGGAGIHTLWINQTGGAGGAYSAGVSTGGNTAGATGITGSNLVFVGAGVVSLSQTTGANGGTLSIQVPATSSLSATGPFSISTNGSTISMGVQNVNVYAASNTFGTSSGTADLRTLSIVGSGAVSVAASNSGWIISAPVQSNQAFSAAGGSTAFQTLGFSDNAAGSFTNTNGSVAIASVRASLYAVSNTTQSSSGTQNLNALSFAGAGIASVGITNGTVVVSVPAGGGGGDGVNIIAAGTQTANTTDTVMFSNSNGISFGMSNSSVVTASFENARLSGYNPFADIQMVSGQLGQATLQFEPERMPNVQFDRVVFQMTNSNATNSSGSHTISVWVGVYTRNVSTLSLWGSTSTSVAATHSGTAGSYSLYSGIRHVTIPWTTTITEGQYWLGFLSRTTSGGANGTYGNLVMSNIASNFVGHFGSSNNTTQQFTLGQGVYTATTAGMPGSVGFSQIRGSDSMAMRFPSLMFASSTV